MGLETPAPAPVLERNVVGEHARPVIRFLPDEASRQSLLVGPGPHKDIGVQGALDQELGQGRMVPEAVDGKADVGPTIKLLLEVALRVERLADKGLAARDVTVGLDPPTAREFPSPLGHPSLDLLEHAGVDALYPGVEGRGTDSEAKVGVLLHPVQRRAEARQDLLVPFLPQPQPHGIDVGVADHM